MKIIFIVQHRRPVASGHHDVKFIGAYRFSDSAHAAIHRLKLQPGFRDHPGIVDPLEDKAGAGFCIDECELEKDHWAEGFGTV